MIPSGVEIYFGVEPIDLRWGFDRLCGVVTERIGRRPRSGAIFVFFGRRRQAMKVFYFDGSGLCVFYKRLDAATFRMPLADDGEKRTIVLSERQLADLFAGLDIQAKPTRH